MSTHVVEDPSGRTWRVGVPLLPWRPRWRGLAPWRRRARDEELADDTASRGDERYATGRVAGEFVAEGLLQAPLELFFGALAEGLAPALLAAVVGGAIVVLLLGGLVLALELVIALLVALGAISLRVVLRRPWEVVAINDEGGRRARPQPHPRLLRPPVC